MHARRSINLTFHSFNIVRGKLWLRLTPRPGYTFKYTSKQLSQTLLIANENPLVRRLEVGVFPCSDRLYKAEQPEGLWAGALVQQDPNLWRWGFPTPPNCQCLEHVHYYSVDGKPDPDGSS